MSDITSRLLNEIGTELEHLAGSADPEGADESTREPYETRLRSLRDAAIAAGREDR